MPADYKALKSDGFMQQRQKDNFSLRLKVVGGNLTAGQLVTIAEIARKYGDGHVHLTSRQGVEIPFIKLDDIGDVKAGLEAGGVNTGVCGPRVRTVTACQGSEICPSGCIETYPLAVEISERYFGRELPHKFKIGVTGCRNNCLKAEGNDLGIKGGYEVTLLPELCTLCGACVKVCRDGAISMEGESLVTDESGCGHCGRCVKVCPVNARKGESGYMLSFGGTFGNRIAQGRQILPIIMEKETLFRVADRAVEFFGEHGSSGERFRTAIERAGWDAFEKAILDAYKKEPINA
ncbi:hypothetical protein FACS1894191_0140 [Clostridia bacterium]|nr:hypothetical protein FACS1894191_0140 [Clostridia bacterium]